MINVLFLTYDISCSEYDKLALLTKNSLNTATSRENKTLFEIKLEYERKNCTQQTTIEYRKKTHNQINIYRSLIIKRDKEEEKQEKKNVSEKNDTLFHQCFVV